MGIAAALRGLVELEHKNNKHVLSIREELFKVRFVAFTAPLAIGGRDSDY